MFRQTAPSAAKTISILTPTLLWHPMMIRNHYPTRNKRVS